MTHSFFNLRTTRFSVVRFVCLLHYGLDNRRTRIRFPEGEEPLFSLPGTDRLWNSPGIIHSEQLSQPLPPRVRRSGLENNDPLTSTVDFKNLCGALTPLPHTSSWHGH
jgi:hypothetical protein